MAEVIIPEGYGQGKLTWSMTGKTNPVTCLMGYSAALTPPADAAEWLYDAAVADGSICDAAYMGPNFTFEGVEVIQNVGGDLEGAAFGDPVPGEYTVTAQGPISCTFLVQKKTASVGRWARGRMYLPNMFVNESAIDNMGNIESSNLALLRSLALVFYDGLTATSEPKPFLLHSDAGRAPTAITTLAAQAKIATQRRRLRS